MTTVAGKAPLMGNKMYDIVKYVTEIGLPAAGTLYFTLASIWGMPFSEQIVGTIAAVTVFLGVLLGLSRKSYNKSDAKYDGTVEIEETSDGKLFSLQIDEDPEYLDRKNEILFRVKSENTK